VGTKKLAFAKPYRDWMSQAIAFLNGSVLPITIDSADLQSRLPAHHRDPFDRLLIAQAQIESIPIISADRIFDAYGVTRLW
jgi:PIN domain nuclease of toxin-antitoxin system